MFERVPCPMLVITDVLSDSQSSLEKPKFICSTHATSSVVYCITSFTCFFRSILYSDLRKLGSVLTNILSVVIVQHTLMQLYINYSTA